MNSMAKRMPIADFVKRLEEAAARKDGYIMGATGQDPRKWKVTSWWFTQYTGKKKEKALYWREHAERVWDCNGLAEGLYKDFSGVDINSKARYNYRDWCGVKGSGLIPAKRRVPGAAVFWSDSGSGSIHHVAYLIRPVVAGKPEADWWMIEARGVMYGVVITKLMNRKPNFWGWMDKYFDYESSGSCAEDACPIAFVRNLKNGCEGEDVRQLQSGLIRLGYDLGRWGADGDFGDATEAAVRAFQRNQGLSVDGIAGPKTIAALEKALVNAEKAGDKAMDEGAGQMQVQISGGQCYVRVGPGTDNAILGVAHEGERFEYAGDTSENGWLYIVWKTGCGWVSGKYGRMV